MTRAELAELEMIVRRVVRAELAAIVHSRRASQMGIGAPGQGAPCSDEMTNRGSMDPFSMDADGASRSPPGIEEAETLARRDIARLRRGLPLTPTSPGRVTKRRAGR